MDKKPEECKAGAPDWMVTYGDLVTLLMCFFVLLFAFSEIDAQKFEAVMKSFQGSAGVLESGKSLSEDQLVFDASPEADTSAETSDAETVDILQEKISEARDALEEAFDGKPFQSDIVIEVLDNKLVIRLKNNVLFDPGKDDIKEGALDALTIIGEVLQGELFTASLIEIEGHTDDVPINTQEFPDNITLSFARSYAVRKYLITEFDFPKERLKSGASGEFSPIDTNLTAEGRANNRRVEIIIENFDFKGIEDVTAGETP